MKERLIDLRNNYALKYESVCKVYTVWRGTAWRGTARQGTAGQGKARQGLFNLFRACRSKIKFLL